MKIWLGSTFRLADIADAWCVHLILLVLLPAGGVYLSVAVVVGPAGVFFVAVFLRFRLFLLQLLLPKIKVKILNLATLLLLLYIIKRVCNIPL